MGDDLKILADWMTGSFSSEELVKIDSSYLDIRMEMFPIWTDRTDGYWLFVEQAVAIHAHEPYRLRVYHLTQRDEGTFVSDIYMFEDPLRFAGAWKKPELLANVTPDSLTLREGCSIILTRDATGSFIGGTVGEGCSSSLNNAVYATSEVQIAENVTYSWDRGFDAEGNRLWGAEYGGYVFKKIPPQ
jgi:hypothetical protein